MKTLISILMLSIALAAVAENGGSDVDSTYFHPAASLYIHGDAPAASNLVAQGLSRFPDDGKLLRLKELLEQQQEQQNQDEQEQQSEEQEQQDPSDQEQQKDESEDEQNAQPNQQQSEPQSTEQMTQDEAEQLLDAMKQEEENKRLQLHPVMGAPVKVDKDW